MSRFTIEQAETDQERCTRLARHWTWAGVAAAILAVDIVLFGQSVPDATVLLALALAVIGVVARASPAQKAVNRRIDVCYLKNVSFPIAPVAIYALMTLWLIEVVVRGGLSPSTTLGFAGLTSAPACLSIADYYRTRSKREALAPELVSVRRIDVVIPIQSFVGNRFTTEEARLRIDTSSAIDVLVEKLAPALRLSDVTVEPDHLEVVAPPLSRDKLVESLRRCGITIDGPLDEAALTSGAVLAAHA